MQIRVTVAVVLLCAGIALADWPQFMGPNGNGTITRANVAREWPDGGPPTLWRAEVGVGFGGPAIAAGKVYLLDRVGEQQDKLRCFDLKDGKELWSFAYDAPGKVSYPGSRSTPAVDGNRVYTIGPFGHMQCVDITTRKSVWSTNLATDHGAQRGGWAFAQSPLVIDNLVIASIQNNRQGLVAFDKATGKVAWMSGPIGGGDTYTSPMLATIAGVRQIVMLQKGALAGVNPADGKILWSYGGYDMRRPIPQPVIIPDGRVFMTSGYKSGCAMVKVEKTADGFKVTELFKDMRHGCKVAPAILWDGHIYANCEDIGEGLTCMTVDGEVLWKTARNPGFDLGSLLIADGLIYIMDGGKGILRLVEASPKGYKELASAQVLGGKQIWAPMALSDGLLVLRDQSQMKCLNVGAK